MEFIKEDQINGIDVKKTIAAILQLQNPKEIFSVVLATEKELKEDPIELPPEDSWELMFYYAKQGEHPRPKKEEYPPEKLLNFIKLSEDLQKKDIVSSLLYL
jgi:hypothetical protein